MENGIMEISVEKQLISASGCINLKIDTKIEVGGLIVLFGDSGAGKTTLLRMVAGLTQPDRGFIRVNGKTWFDSVARINLPPQQRSIGFMFQDYALFPNMSVLENILFAQKTKNKTEALQLIDTFGLTELAYRKPTKLSGGQKQRVALARSLACGPQFLLLDEPLSALDAKTRSNLQDEILKAHQYRNTTTLLVSHDLAEVFRLAQKVIRIEHGKIVAFGTPDDLFIDNQISGKVQMTGKVVKVEKHDTFFLLTVVTGMNQLIKVTAFANDMENIHEGDQVMVFSKAFNPIVVKI
jgi:molybdate transport system ATP-binding protein